MRMVTMLAPQNHGPSISIGGSQVAVVDGKIQVFDLYADTLKAHGFTLVEGSAVEAPPQRPQKSDDGQISFSSADVRLMLKQLGDKDADDIAEDQLGPMLMAEVKAKDDQMLHAVEKAEKDVEYRMRRDFNVTPKKKAAEHATPRFQP